MSQKNTGIGELIDSYKGYDVFIFELVCDWIPSGDWAMRMSRGKWVAGCIVGDMQRMTKDEAKAAAISLARETADAIIAESIASQPE
jgi:hypothetical protein